MPRPNRVEIEIGAKTDELRQAEGMIRKFGDSLRTGFGIDVAARITSAMSRLPDLMRGLVETGIQFDSTVASAQIGLSGILKKFGGSEFATFEHALMRANDLVGQLKASARETTADFTDLLAAYQAVAGPMFAAGVPINHQIELTSLIAQSVAGLGIGGGGREGLQLIQEGRALLTGNIGPDAQLARILLNTDAKRTEYRSALASGRIFQFLKTELADFSEAGRRAAKTLSGATSNLRDVFQQEAGAAMIGAYEKASNMFLQLQGAVSSQGFRDGARRIGEVATTVIGAGGATAGVAARNLDALTGAVEALAVALGAKALPGVISLLLKIPALLRRVTQMILPMSISLSRLWSLLSVGGKLRVLGTGGMVAGAGYGVGSAFSGAFARVTGMVPTPTGVDWDINQGEGAMAADPVVANYWARHAAKGNGLLDRLSPEDRQQFETLRLRNQETMASSAFAALDIHTKISRLEEFIHALDAQMMRVVGSNPLRYEQLMAASLRAREELTGLRNFDTRSLSLTAPSSMASRGLFSTQTQARLWGQMSNYTRDTAKAVKELVDLATGRGLRIAMDAP